MADTSDEHPITGENPAIVSNAGIVEHAELVSHTEKVEHVEVHGEPLRSDKERRLSHLRDIARTAVIFFALLVMIVVIFDKNANENNLKHQLEQFQSARAESDKVTAAKLDCVRRFTDVTDTYRSKQLVLISDFLIIITQIPPGPDRVAAVNDKITELDKTNNEAKAAIAAKVDYTNSGNQLPCPLVATPNPIDDGLPPEVREVLPTTTIPPTTSIP